MNEQDLKDLQEKVARQEIEIFRLKTSVQFLKEPPTKTQELAQIVLWSLTIFALIWLALMTYHLTVTSVRVDARTISHQILPKVHA